MKKILMALLVSAAASVSAYAGGLSEDGAAQEIVVTGSRVRLPASKAGPGVIVITRQDIDKLKPDSFIDILRTVPGFTIIESGAGKLPYIYIRGGNDSMTAVFIDGVPLYDSAHTDANIDFSSISLDDIEKIEIVKGPVSASMGSGAMNGAINIITEKGSGKAINGEAGISSSLGSLHYKGEGKVYGSAGFADYYVSGSYLYDEGVSAASRKYGNREKDDDAMGSFSARLGISPLDDLCSYVYFNYTDRQSAIDNGPGENMDNPDYLMRIRRYFAAWETKYLFMDVWEPSLKVYYTDQKRLYGTAASVSSDDTSEYYTGRNVGVDFQNNFYILDQLILTGGFSFNRDEAVIHAWNPSASGFDTYDAFIQNYAGYLQATVSLFDSWTTVLAVRGDKSGENGFKPTYRVSTVYDIKALDFQLKGAFGTGFRTPSLYQTYDPTYGNRQLDPQTSISYEAGVSNGLFDRIIVWEATWFDNWYDNLIIFDPASYRYKNVDSAHTRGIEASVSVYPFSWLDITGSYMYLQTFDQNGQPVVRRPEHQGAVSLTLRPLKGLSVFAEMLFRGKSPASVYDADPSVNSYELLNATVSYAINDNFQVWLKGTNLTDRQYEEIAGYGTKGIEVMLGLKMRI